MVKSNQGGKVYLAYAFISLFIIKGRQARSTNKELKTGADAEVMEAMLFPGLLLMA